MLIPTSHKVNSDRGTPVDYAEPINNNGIASPAELVSRFIPTGAGGLGYLFDHGVSDLVSTPLQVVGDEVRTLEGGTTRASNVTHSVSTGVPTFYDTVRGEAQRLGGTLKSWLGL